LSSPNALPLKEPVNLSNDRTSIFWGPIELNLSFFILLVVMNVVLADKRTDYSFLNTLWIEMSKYT
jgi:hypothetical protein